MCGLIGMASTEGTKDWMRRRAVFTEGLITDSFRGDDSTGIAIVRKGDEKKPAEVYKKALAGWDFVQLDQYKRYANDFDRYSIVLGHNRSATRDGISDSNAHPFSIGNITLVHNGTLTTVYDLEVKDLVKTGVDSEAICAAIHKYGEKDALERLRGSFSLVWHNSDDGSLNFARNDQRPMFLAYADKENTLYWASEMEMLWMLLRRNGITMDGKFKLPSVMNHYKMFTDDLRRVGRTPFAAPKQHGHSYMDEMGGHWRGHGTRSTNTDNTATTVVPSAGTSTIKEADIGKAVKKPDKNIGEVSAPGKIDKVNSKLEKFNIKLGDRVLCQLRTFHPYRAKDQTLGVVRGNTVSGMIDVEVHNIDVDRWKEIIRWGSVHVKVNNLRYTGGVEVIIAVMSDYRDSEHARRWNQQRQIQNQQQQHPRLPWANRAFAANEDGGLSRLVPGPGGGFITAAKFQEYAKTGCGDCGGNVNILYSDEVGWIGDTPTPICHECMSDKETVQRLGIVTMDRDNVVPIDAHSMLN